jgi:hypothetical protein
LEKCKNKANFGWKNAKNGQILVGKMQFILYNIEKGEVCLKEK